MVFVSSLALFVPLVLILALRLGNYRTFPALIVYYTLTLVYNLFTGGFISASPDLVRYWGLTNNLLDIPLVLYFLTYFSTSREFTQKMHFLIAAFVLFEIVVVFITGFTVQSITITLGPGLVIVVGLCLFFFIRQAKMAVTHRKATGKALLVSALLFAYGCFSFIYLMYYVFKAHLDEFGKVKAQYQADTFLVYFLVTTFSSILMCTGIIVERKRIRQLNELKITRRELSSLYEGTKSAAPYRRAMLDFDKDHWN
jgi:hypothetical protein